MTEHHPTLSDDIHAMLDWWQAAGVDHDFTDDATAWLADTDETGQSTQDAKMAPGGQAQAGSHSGGEHTAKHKAAPVIDLLGDSPPKDLAEFQEFWLTAPGLDAIGPRGRVPPRGAAKPKLMVLVVDPEEGDRETLLGGPQGRLLANMLSAMGIDEDDIYLASALPRHTPMADTDALVASGIGAVLAHHINLVGPERIIAFGSNIPSLLRHGVTKDETHLREINQNHASQIALVSEGLDSLMTMPRLKARFWRRWIECSA